jgi:hypothetical protein
VYHRLLILCRRVIRALTPVDTIVDVGNFVGIEDTAENPDFIDAAVERAPAETIAR